jgi:hypothetical protein
VELVGALECGNTGVRVVVGGGHDVVYREEARHEEHRGGAEWLSLSLVRPYGNTNRLSGSVILAINSHRKAPVRRAF